MAQLVLVIGHGALGRCMLGTALGLEPGKLFVDRQAAGILYHYWLHKCVAWTE